MEQSETNVQVLEENLDDLQVIVSEEDLEDQLSNLSPEEYEKRKAEAIAGIQSLEVEFREWVQFREETIRQLREIADYVEKVFRRAGRTKIASSGGSVLAGGVTVVGGILTLASGGLALPILVAGAGLGLASGLTGGAAAVSEKVIKSKSMKKAEKALQLDAERTEELESSLKEYRKRIVAQQIIQELVSGGAWGTFNGYQVVSVLGAGIGFTQSSGKVIMAVSGETLGSEFTKLAAVNSGRLLAGTITIVVGGALMAYDIYQLAQGIQGFAQMGPEGAADIRQIANELEAQMEILTTKDGSKGKESKADESKADKSKADESKTEKPEEDDS